MEGGEIDLRVDPWNNNYVLWPLTAMPMPIIMGMLKMQLSPATIYAPRRDRWTVIAESKHPPKN